MTRGYMGSRNTLFNRCAIIPRAALAVARPSQPRQSSTGRVFGFMLTQETRLAGWRCFYCPPLSLISILAHRLKRAAALVSPECPYALNLPEPRAPPRASKVTLESIIIPASRSPGFWSSSHEP